MIWLCLLFYLERNSSLNHYLYLSSSSPFWTLPQRTELFFHYLELFFSFSEALTLASRQALASLNHSYATSLHIYEAK